MKKILSKAKTAFILLLITGFLLNYYIELTLAPLTYDVPYINETLYDTKGVEETLTFHGDGRMILENSSLDEPIVKYYHYRGGYIFMLRADTEEGRREEIKYIEKNFQEALAVPSYAASINSIIYTTENLEKGEDGYFIYACKNIFVFAVVGGIVVLSLIGLTCTSLILHSQEKRREKAQKNNS